VRVLAAVFALLFAFAAFVNFNDPDSMRWIALYGLATVVAAWRALSATGPPAPLPIGVAVVAGAWAANLLPGVLGKVGWGEMTAAWEMKNTRIEEGREFWGLTIVVVAMLMLAFIRPRPERT
jgi:hypothetical protein